MPQRPIEARRPVAAARAKQPDAATTESVRLRDGTADDAPALVALINAAYRPVDWWLFEQLRTDAEELSDVFANPDAQVIVAEIDGSVAGDVVLTLRPGAADIGLVAVAPDAQGRGIATLMIAEAERRARAAGHDALHLHCIRENGLQPYYESLGYAAAGEEHGRMWESLHEFTLVHMRKVLR